MADGVKVSVRNKDRLFRKLGRLAPAAFEEIKQANHQAADEMAELAKTFVPIKSGDLRDSIVVTPPGSPLPAYSQGGGAGVVPDGSFAVSAGNDAVRYAHLVEFGASPHVAGGMFAGAEHPGAKAQPFFWPAFRIVKRKLTSRVRAAMRKATKKAADR